MNSEDYAHGPVWKAFGLSYCAYFVAPRRSLQSMPAEWQSRFLSLMQEAIDALPEEAFPEYTVQRRINGRFAKDPMADYRHTGPIIGRYINEQA